MTSKVKEKSYRGTPTSKKYSKIFKQEAMEHPHLFKTFLLRTFKTRQEARYSETKLLRYFDAKNNSMYINMSNADGVKNVEKHAPETKAKISESMSGSNNHMYGKKRSEEFKLRHSLIMKQRHSEGRFNGGNPNLASLNLTKHKCPYCDKVSSFPGLSKHYKNHHSKGEKLPFESTLV